METKWNDYDKSATVWDFASVSSRCSYWPKVLVANGCRIWQNSGILFSDEFFQHDSRSDSPNLACPASQWLWHLAGQKPNSSALPFEQLI
jgi:hypothetical protein